MLWAQQVAEVGNAGLLNVVLQGGSFAALVAGLGWAGYWVPRWVAANEVTRQREADAREKVAAEYREAVRLVMDGHKAGIGAMLAEFASQQKYEREQCARQFELLMGEGQRNRDLQMQSFDLLRRHHEAATSYMTSAREGGRQG